MNLDIIECDIQHAVFARWNKFKWKTVFYPNWTFPLWVYFCTQKTTCGCQLEWETLEFEKLKLWKLETLPYETSLSNM